MSTLENPSFSITIVIDMFWLGILTFLSIHVGGIVMENINMKSNKFNTYFIFHSACFTSPTILSNCPPHHGVLLVLNCHFISYFASQSCSRSSFMIRLIEPLCCCYKRLANIAVYFLGPSSSGDEAFQALQEVVRVLTLQQLQIHCSRQTACVQYDIRLSFTFRHLLIPYWSSVVHSNNLKGRIPFGSIFGKVSRWWTGYGDCSKSFAGVENFGHSFDDTS